MLITHVLTAVNESERYTRFIPLFIESWKKNYPNIQPIVIYTGRTELDPIFSVYKKYIIYYETPESIDTAFAAQTIRLLYPSLLPEDSCILISDIDMMVGKSNYFIDPINHISDSAFVCFRPLSVVGPGEIAMCYNSARCCIWKSIFGIHTVDDISKFLILHMPVYDGIHGGVGWQTDQKLLYDYLMRWKNLGNDVFFLDDEDTKFSRLDFFHHRYDIEVFKKMVEITNSDVHLFSHACPWSSHDIINICKILYQPSILLLVIANEEPLYNDLMHIWRQYMNTHNHIDSYFIIFNPNIDQPYIQDNTLYLKGQESYDNIINKTIEAVDFFLKEKPYTHIVRTNLSSLWNFTNLYTFIKSLPNYNLYCGFIGHWNNIFFSSGAGIIMSNDICKTIINNKEQIYNTKLIDDVAIGLILGNLGIKITPASRIDFNSLNSFSPTTIPSDTYHFRLKCVDRTEELKLVKTVFKFVYSDINLI